jgi:hypothetical protein
MSSIGKVIQGLDVMDIIAIIGKKNRKYQAVLLGDIEEVIGKDSEEYLKIRKLILDSFNGYTRSILRLIFGDDFE